MGLGRVGEPERCGGGPGGGGGAGPAPFEGLAPELVGSAAEFPGGNRQVGWHLKWGRRAGPGSDVVEVRVEGVEPGRVPFEGSAPQLVGSVADFRGGNPQGQGLTPQTGPGRGAMWQRSGCGVEPGRPGAMRRGPGGGEWSGTRGGEWRGVGSGVEGLSVDPGG